MSETSIRAAVYLRISLDRNMDGLAIDRQREDCLRIAQDRGWQVVEEYADQSKSATDKSKVRPAYNKMVADYDAGRFAAIICWDLDRLTRQPRQLEDWIDVAQENGLLLVTANGEADLTTDSGRLFARVKAAVARSEVERKSARQSRSQVQRAEQGRAPKGVRPLGYATSGDVVEHEAVAVHEIFRLFAIGDGPSIASIARGLSGQEGQDVPSSLPHLPKHSRTLVIERNARREAEGLEPRPVPNDGPWVSSTLLGILRNPRYAGYSVYTDRLDRKENKRRTWHAQILRDGDGEPVGGQWTPIVTEDMWWRVQERLNAPERITNKTGSTARKHLGAGLYLCGVCEKPVRTHGQRYRCEGHVMRSRKQVDDWVLSIIRARLGRPDLRDVISAVDEPRVQAITAQIDTHRAKIKRAQHDYDAEIIEGRDLKRVRDQANPAIDALEAERRSLTASADLGGVLDMPDPVAAFDGAPLMIQRRVIDFLATVHLYSHPRGKKTFDPHTVSVVPKHS
ncbi:recombinase family protein [Nesterenkonia sp. CF4.4]|uniref:recombinase family protein n=1 Tax=Nesterenkonia sp. CF4.4 TaxID=3373079 RepID=UPI003EE4EE9E